MCVKFCCDLYLKILFGILLVFDNVHLAYGNLCLHYTAIIVCHMLVKLLWSFDYPVQWMDVPGH